MSVHVQYNERAWATELISHINLYCSQRNRPIARAGGEYSLPEQEERTLFPDVILFGDDQGVRVRHGWELKFPDTQITDDEFYDNARTKARRLRVNSFSLWNVNEARLYVSSESADGEFELLKSWEPIGVHSRSEVKLAEEKWMKLLFRIVDDLNDFFDLGTLRSSTVEKIFDENFLARVIGEYSTTVARSIEHKANERAVIDAKIRLWWRANASEYGKRPKDKVNYNILARICLTNWVNRFLFGHCLKKFHSAAKSMESITHLTPIEEAEEIFLEITKNCDFLQVFEPEIMSEHIGPEAWHALCEVNAFLTSLDLESVPQNALRKIVDSALVTSGRKFAGQYTTPMPLARLLVNLSMENRSGSVLDPCCGTGTIPKAAYELKIEKDVSRKSALGSVWASDKFQYPLQLCTLALTDPLAMGEVVQVFRRDVFELQTDGNLRFTNPDDGTEVTRKLEALNTIVSNLPFVRFEDIPKANPDMPKSLKRDIPPKSDLFAYILMHLKDLVQDHGNIGVIVSNSWLSSDWGIRFRGVLQEHFHIKAIATSGHGRWFDATDVVANIVVLSKKYPSEDDKTLFFYTKKDIGQWDSDYVSSVCAEALLAKRSGETDHASYSLYTKKDLETMGKYCVGWSPFFSDIRWINDLAHVLVKASSLFEINRGERRGWNPLFYPDENNRIEEKYKRPVLRSIADVKGYVAGTSSVAFCCSDSIDYLEENGFSGALGWIKKFECGFNTNGRPLPEVLALPNHKWYEMKPDRQADMVLGMNLGDRIFVAIMENRGFVDQRLIRLTKKKDDLDLHLCHALLNSLLGLYMIESSGFGRGLGALDLQSTKLKKGLYVLNPFLLSKENKTGVKKLFQVLKRRNVLPLPDELSSSDRLEFDKAVLKSFGISACYNKIKHSLLELYDIRKSANP